MPNKPKNHVIPIDQILNSYDSLINAIYHHEPDCDIYRPYAFIGMTFEQIKQRNQGFTTTLKLSNLDNSLVAVEFRGESFTVSCCFDDKGICREAALCPDDDEPFFEEDHQSDDFH